MIGVFATAVSLGGSWRPSFWYDEAATISASYSRSVSQLWHMIGNVDAVHGLYYLLMHGWFQVFPPTEFWARAPSSLAVGGAAAGVVVLGKQLSSRTAAAVAGVLFAILPRTTWAGIEARPYAVSMLAAVWLCALLVFAARRAGTWIWVSYAIALALSTVLDVYLALLVLSHAVYLCVFHRGRKVLLPFLIASAAAICAVAPFVLAVVRQAHQISWVTPIGHRTIEDVAIQQYFERCPPFAVLSLLVVAAATFARRRSSRQLADTDRQLLTLAIAWVVIPTTLIITWSLVHPIYTPRYLAFTAPAIALILGVCVATVAAKRWVAVAVVIAFIVAAVPNYLGTQRSPYAKYGMDYSQVADLISTRAAPGDCLLVNDTVSFMPAPMRPLLAARPDTYRRLDDVSLWQRATERDDVFDTNLIAEVVAEPLSRCKVVWIVTEADKSMPSHEQGAALPPGPRYGETSSFAVPHDLGFRLVERWQFNLVQVIEAVGPGR